MERLKHIAQQVQEELDGAEGYICEAIKCKKQMPGVAAIYADMTNQELTHAMRLFDIGDTVAKEADDSETCVRVWEWFREMMGDWVGKVRKLQETYKG